MRLAKDKKSITVNNSLTLAGIPTEVLEYRLGNRSVIEKAVRRQCGGRVIDRVESVRERFYAISVERKDRHPAVVAIAHAGCGKLFWNLFPEPVKHRLKTGATGLWDSFC
ncbi:MAG: hypothetical protein GY842_03480 [bacterium]|nr:hypothetical protein [bacterium]